MNDDDSFIDKIIIINLANEILIVSLLYRYSIIEKYKLTNRQMIWIKFIINLAFKIKFMQQTYNKLTLSNCLLCLLQADTKEHHLYNQKIFIIDG